MHIDPKELEMGTKIEHEHTKDDALARKIATDHLKEDPRYYSKLKAAGLEEGEDSKWEDYKKKHGEEEIEDAYGKKHKVKDLNWHPPRKKGGVKKEGALIPLEAGMAECGENVATVVAIGADDVKSVSQGDVVSGGQKPLTSSGLGDSGQPKPLASDNLDAPESKMVGPNKIATSKTPSMPGAPTATADPLDHFGSAMMGLFEGGSQIKKSN